MLNYILIIIYLLLLAYLIYVLYIVNNICESFTDKTKTKDIFDNFYISIICTRNYQESVTKLVNSIPDNFKIIIIYQDEKQLNYNYDDTGKIIVNIENNIFEYGHWIGLHYLLENNVISPDSKILLMHSTSLFLGDPTEKIREVLYDMGDNNIYYIGAKGESNVCIIDKIAIEYGYNIYKKFLTMDKKYAIDLEFNPNLEDSPKSWNIKQKYNSEPRQEIGTRAVYSTNIERIVTYYPSLNMEKYISLYINKETEGTYNN
jgi:hypothetical protein